MNLLTQFESFREFLTKMNPSLVCVARQVVFAQEKPNELEILCLLTQIRRVRIGGVGPRMGLELKTEQLTQGFKSAVFLKVFSSLHGPIETQAAMIVTDCHSS